ncbi:MAG TPA: helix-turn-helix domain-containing GNAT family N-acetyltransferase [Chryseolinea sp.]|nr:helix-turn-helix domain-containing GNAT family N-acetyltransferase [Chryseolinea sp.]
MKRHIREIRSFNRFYTAHLGLLNKRLLQSDYSLGEVRILFEIARLNRVTARDLANFLLLDKGYVSRIISGFVRDGLAVSTASSRDKRLFEINLSAKGHRLLQTLQQRSDAQVAELIQHLDRSEMDAMVKAMRTVKILLAADYGKDKLAEAITFRDILKAGDLGYLIYLHGKIYAQESGYTLEFEGYVAKTFYEFVEQYDRDHDKIWLALYNDEIVASIAILKRSHEEAQLRWFLVHPMFRGTGIGRKLLDTALSYCAQRFVRVYLMTADTQHQAIAMYKKAGFSLVSSVEAEQWGKRLREERYELVLNS